MRLSLTLYHLSCAGCVVHVDMHGDFGECVMLWVAGTFIVAILFRILYFIIGLLFVVNIDTLNTSRRAPKPSQDREDLPYSKSNLLFPWDPR